MGIAHHRWRNRRNPDPDPGRRSGQPPPIQTGPDAAAGIVALAVGGVAQLRSSLPSGP